MPFLKDIPVLGHMFRSVTDLRQRTNLLILITPRIVRDQFDARDVTVDQRDKIENEITARELYPSRDEFLRNPDIDSVVTEEYFEGQIPSTMTAPRFGADSRGDSPGSLVEAPSTFQPGGDDGVMEFTVKPKFSAGSAEHLGAQQPDVATALQASNLDSGRARLSSPLPAGSQRGALVVLRLTGSSSNSASLPFSITSKNGLASIFIPEGSGASASGFFRTGQSVGYAVDDAVLNFEVAGVFTSIEEASKLFEGLGQDWHTLSPYEIMSLGEGPWIRAR
ncbi:MAG: hypothetical protein DCC75_01810 [Proteobacteria bacterium]|nr:MAG: hypothetical protein DCC75_01810 [Pseudomonadota bacterium]